MPRPAPLRVLRADGQRIDLTNRETGRQLVATKQSWQSQAFAYRDLIGELRYAIRLLSRSVARVRFYPAQLRPWPEDPTPLDGKDHNLDKQLAADAVHNFSRLPIDNDPDGFIARSVENLSIAGEAWVLAKGDDFAVHSTSEIVVVGDGQVYLTTLPTATVGNRRLIDPTKEDLLRTWVPHPEWGQLADSPLRCLLDVCEDVVLAGREQRAAARSRVAANGILLIPSTLSLVRSRDEDDESDDGVTSDTFMADFTAAMLAPIRDDSDPQAVVPIVLRGEIEDLKEVRHVVLQRADADHLIRRQDGGIIRLLRGVDVQPEQVQGLMGGNHWSGWLVEASAIQHQVKPMAQTEAACLLQAFLKPALISLGHDPAMVAQVTIAVDVSDLVENPNRVADAKDAWDRVAISDESLREALGFDEDDKPDEFEVIRRSLTHGRITPQAIPLIIKALEGQLPDATDIANATGQTMPHPVIINGEPVAPALPAGQKRPAAQPGQTIPNQPVPTAPTGGTPGPVAASASSTGDTVLVERITIAADAAIARVLERAGARVRNAAQKDRALVASLTGVEPHLIPARLGRERVEMFVPVTDLLASDYTRLRGQVGQWLTDAGYGASVDTAWAELAAALNTAADRALFATDIKPGDMLIHPTQVHHAITVAVGKQGGTS